MSKILVFQHVAAEPLGTLDALIRARGHRIRFVNFSRDPDASPEISRYDGLVVLGGPMNVEQRHVIPHLEIEIELIRQALALNKPILGICLGAQLLATALGASVRKNPVSEIGWYELNITDSGINDPVAGKLPRQSRVFQWHSYTFELPEQAVHLATSLDCENQAFVYGDHAYGFQFHLEMDQSLINRWLAIPDYLVDLSESNATYSADEIQQQTHTYLKLMQQNAQCVFEAFLDQVGQPKSRMMLSCR